MCTASQISQITLTLAKTQMQDTILCRDVLCFLNVRVCCWVGLEGPVHTPHPPTHQHTPRPHSLFQEGRAGLTPLQSSAPGPLLKCIIVWAELVGSSESPTESHTEFVFLYESRSDCFCFISLAKLPRSTEDGRQPSIVFSAFPAL